MIFFHQKYLKSHRSVFFSFFLLIIVLYFSRKVQATAEDDAIRKWAKNIGDELWQLGQRMTKSNEIKMQYQLKNARVKPKDGQTLMNSIAENVGRMLRKKMDAVKCILNQAELLAENFDYNETLAENFTYYSSKYSLVNNERAVELVESLLPNAGMYNNMTLDEDTHFYNISVNTDYSAVHVPSNIYDKNPKVLETLMWSEGLDEVFIENYNRDPALSWQYFGSDTGIMRHYPALQWQEPNVDVYDCRKRSWYIETATCSKDIIILLDNSGSMTGFRNHIAKLTVRSILDTFSNNDFINIFNYSNTVDDLVPCFKDMLVQATPENIEVFNNAIAELQPEGYANVSRAYEKAFELLEQYRINRRCNESTTGCNQAIMLITDGVVCNSTEVFEQYNRFEENTNSIKIPVRIFAYLLGKEITKVREIQWMACFNRGYYSHIQTLDEVQEEVLKYVSVIATPLVLQDVEHPPTWTHAFTDQTVTYENENTVPRLMIAVGVPAYDRKINHNKNETKRARLLGVAGTDVPIEDLDKLTLPYKLGVNGYSFIISNNGYVLLHPDLRPMENNRLKKNYNSIDFTEVEQINDDRPVRDPGPDLMELRNNLISHKQGKVSNIPVKFHFDKMRRVSPELQDYYYAPLPNTPFSLGLVLPSNYGNTWIKVGEQVQQIVNERRESVDSYFTGQNWKVHPDWVYCKYHYLEGHEFATPEDELRHFLKRFHDVDWKWSEQYEPDENERKENDSAEALCTGPTLGIHDYYCNKELVETLVFDARVTHDSYKQWLFKNAEERNLIEKKYNATLRYVATMSGLTRWQFIHGEVEVDTDTEFGDYHKYAIDETWYKSAILQHAIDPDSFIYSVPHETDPPEEGELKVTASYAIFPRDGGKEAPASVVGFQFSHALFMERFANITSQENCDGCVKTCNTDEHDCFIIDNNGYVIVSENYNDTGKFFGEIEGAVMEAMVEKNIFKNITVYDLQGLCYIKELDTSEGTIIINPFQLLIFGVNWLFTEFMIYLSRINLLVMGLPYYDDNENEHFDTETVRPGVSNKKLRKGQSEDEEEYFNRVIEPVYQDVYYPCDKQSNLYILNQKMFITGNDWNSYVITNCSRPFHVKRIPNSNLLLIVVKTMYPTCYRPHLTASPQIIDYPIEFPCHKLNLNHFYRRRLEECYTEHPKEAEYSYCGDANFNYLRSTTAIISAIMLISSRYVSQLCF